MAKKKRKPWQQYLSTSGMMYVYSLLFSVAAMVFLMDNIPAWVQIIMGILFAVPVYALFYISGKREGEEMYKDISKGTLTTIHDKAPMKVPVYRSVLYTLGYAVPLIVLTLIAAFGRIAIVRGIVSIFLMPATLVYLGAGVLNFDEVTLNLLYIYLPVIVFGCGVYVFGYLKSVLIMRRRQGEIESELRSFDN